MAAIEDFLKKNAKFAYGGGALGGLFALADIKGIFEADNKFKAIIKTLKDFILVRVALVGTFTAVGAAIRSLVKDTGSLDAALKRLSEVQRVQRIFTPLAGGAKAARQEVANLLNFSARTPFRFESVAEAAQALQGLTKGAFAGTGALKTIGDAAAASGNGLEVSARAVGNFYATLENGQPVKESVGEMRQMGLISEASAQNLDRMAEAGASATQMTHNLTQALEESRGGMTSFAKDLESVTAAHEKASETAKAGFGAGFTTSEVQNTKNYTAAIVAVTPALAASGNMLAKFSNGLSTTVSWLTKTAAQTGILGGAIRLATSIIGAGMIALTVYGATAIPGLIASVAELTGGFGLLAGAVGLLSGGAAVVAFAAIGVALISLVRGSRDADKAIRDLSKAHREAQAAIDGHAAGIETLTDLHEAYGKSISHIIDLQNELNKAEAEGNTKKVAEDLRAIEEARRKMMALPAAGGLGSEERGAVIRERTQRRLMEEESRFQERLRARPGEAPQIRREHAALLERRAAEGETGLLARQRVAERSADLEKTRADIERKAGVVATKEAGTEVTLPTGEKGKRETLIKGFEIQMAAVDAQIHKVGESLGGETAVGLEAQARRIQAAKAAEEAEAAGNKRVARLKRTEAAGAVAGPGAGQRIQDLLEKAGMLREQETRAVEFRGAARAEKGTAIEEERGQFVTSVQTGVERAEVRARITGRTREAERQQDIGAFIADFETLRKTFPDDVAKKMAVANRETTLTAQAANVAAFAPVADSLTKIGGGGGIGGPSGDPMKRVQERIRDLNSQAVEILDQIEKNTAASGTPEPGGGPPEEQPTAPPAEGAAAPPEVPGVTPGAGPAVAPAVTPGPITAPEKPGVVGTVRAAVEKYIPEPEPVKQLLTASPFGQVMEAVKGIPADLTKVGEKVGKEVGDVLYPETKPQKPEEIPSMQTGGEVHKTGPVLLHKGEKVTPASGIQKLGKELVKTVPPELIKLGSKASVIGGIAQELIDPTAAQAKTLEPAQQLEAFEKSFVSLSKKTDPASQALLKRLQSDPEYLKAKAAAGAPTAAPTPAPAAPAAAHREIPSFGEAVGKPIGEKIADWMYPQTKAGAVSPALPVPAAKPVTPHAAFAAAPVAALEAAPAGGAPIGPGGRPLSEAETVATAEKEGRIAAPGTTLPSLAGQAEKEGRIAAPGTQLPDIVKEAETGGRIAAPGTTLPSLAKAAEEGGRIVPAAPAGISLASLGAQAQQTGEALQRPGGAPQSHPFGLDMLGVMKGVLKTNEQSVEHLETIAGKNGGVE